MATKTVNYRIFNIAVFDPDQSTWVIDRYLNNHDLAIAQAAAIAKEHPTCAVFVRAHKSRRDYDGVTLWEYMPEKNDE